MATDRCRKKTPLFRSIQIFGRTDLRKGVSEAKFDAESAFEVRLAVAPPNLDKNVEKQFSKEKIVNKNFRRRKMKCGESSETRFGKV